MRWLDERGRGYVTPGGRVPIVPAAIIYDLVEGDAAARPDAAAGYAACEAATAAVPQRGRVGAGTGAAVGKILGRDRATPAGIGYAAARAGTGETVAAIAVVNAFGDVIGADGRLLAGARGENGEPVSTAATLAAMSEPPDWTVVEERNTTLVCVCTDAALDKPACTRVARMASGGVAGPSIRSSPASTATSPSASPRAGRAGRRTASPRSRSGPWPRPSRPPRSGTRYPITARRRLEGHGARRVPAAPVRAARRGAGVPARAVRAGRGRRHDAGPGDLRTRLEMGEHVGSSPDDRCQVEHLGIVISGRAAVSGPGYEAVMGPGDIFAVPPDHDSWVVGDEPYVSLHLLGASSYAAE